MSGRVDSATTPSSAPASSALATSNATDLAVIFAGGGTGGHIFPALAIAEQLRAVHPGAAASFLCSTRPLDASILAAESAAFTPIPAQPFGLRPRTFYRFATNWGLAVRSVRACIREAKATTTSSRGRVVLVAMGGFVAAPAAQAARVERVPLVLVNLDAAPGRANRWIAGRTKHVFTAAPVREAYATTWTTVRPIVRSAAMATRDAGACRERLGLNRDAPTLLITGASQGAKSLNQLGVEFAKANRAVLASWQIVHQTGEREPEMVRAAYAELGIRARVEPFFQGMGDAWGAADVAVSRAGAGSVAEAWGNRVPTIFMPYPYHKDQHQKLNAQVMVEAKAALCETDLIDPSRNLATIGPKLLALIGDANARTAMREACTRLGPTDGAATIARAIAGLA